MSLSYDLAMQGYFGLYAATMSTVPDLCVPGERVSQNLDRIARNRRARTRIADSAARHPAADPPAIRDRAASGDPAASVSSRTGPNPWATA